MIGCDFIQSLTFGGDIQYVMRRLPEVESAETNMPRGRSASVKTDKMAMNFSDFRVLIVLYCLNSGDNIPSILKREDKIWLHKMYLSNN